jgi:hypothetical protein
MATQDVSTRLIVVGLVAIQTRVLKFDAFAKFVKYVVKSFAVILVSRVEQQVQWRTHIVRDGGHFGRLSTSIDWRSTKAISPPYVLDK